MQCFPVPAGGGTMKIRVGITAPLVLTRTNEAIIRRHIQVVAPSRPPRLVVVLDGGKGSAGLIEDVAQAG